MSFGCGADGIVPAEAPETTATTGEVDTPQTDSTTDPDPATSTGPEDDDDEGSESSESTGAPPAECGNGIVEEGEDCDSDEGYCRDCLLPCRPIAAMPVEDDRGRALWLGAIDVGAGGEVVAVGAMEVSDGDSDVVVARVGESVELQTYDLGEADGSGDGVVVHDDGAVSVLVGDGGFFYAQAVMHLDPAGEVAWITDDFGDARPNGLALTPDGELTVSATAAVGSGDSNVAVFVLDDEGLPQPIGEFSTTLTGAHDNDRAGPLAVDDAGVAYVAALSPSVQGGPQVSDPLVVAFDSLTGESAWDWSVFLGSTNQNLFATQVLVDPAGTIHALYALSHGSGNSNHFQLWQFTPAGDQIGFFDSDDLDYMGGANPAGVVHDPAGRVIVVATRDGSRAEEHEDDIIVLGFEPDGAIACEERFPGPSRTTGVAASPSGDLYISGLDFTGSSLAGSVHQVRGFQPIQ